jgi:hypothetical protein
MVRFMKFSALAASLMALVMAGAAPSSAQQTAAQDDDGPAAMATASAVSYTPIPADATLDMLPADDTDLVNDALELSVRALAQHGHASSPDARYVLNVSAVLVRGIGQDAGLMRLEEGSKRGDQYTNADKSPYGEPLTAGNLFNSEDGAVLNPARPRTGGHLLRVSYEVYDRKSGLYVWRGQIERDSIEVGPDASLQQMIPALLSHFGASLPQTEVPLY